MFEFAHRDKASLDIFWLKDESLEASDNLPDPDVITRKTEKYYLVEKCLKYYNVNQHYLEGGENNAFFGDQQMVFYFSCTARVCILQPGWKDRSRQSKTSQISDEVRCNWYRQGRGSSKGDNFKQNNFKQNYFKEDRL